MARYLIRHNISFANNFANEAATEDPGLLLGRI
jgi:hypothetical protein